MQRLPEFFQGSIAQDFPGILDAGPSPAAAFSELAGKARKPRTSGPVCKRRSIGSACTRPVNRCPRKKNAAVFQPSLEGWSIPVAPLLSKATRACF